MAVKKLLHSDYTVIFSFIFDVIVKLPICLFVLMPLTLVETAMKKIFTRKPKKTENGKRDPIDISQVKPFSKSELAAREFDVVLFGATGFTGKMAAVYMARNYGSSIKWAIAGRSFQKLEGLKKEVEASNPPSSSSKDVSTCDIIVADSADQKALNEMALSTRVILTTAGPFGKYGSGLVEACAVNGTHYCDITGESDWVREMIDRYDDVAKISGARIVHFCGHDCIPWDLLVLELSKKMKQSQDTIAEVHFYDEIRSDPSGGTMDTVFHATGNRIKYKAVCGFDPLVKTDLGQSANKLIAKNTSMLSYSAERRKWIGPFFMAMVMANCVRRSNAINNYSTKLVYKEGMVFASLIAGLVFTIDGLFFILCVMSVPIRNVLLWLGSYQSILPRPGQGPSEKDMDQGWLKVRGFATGTNGTKALVELYFPTDPGYRDTARMLVESGMVLVEDFKRGKPQIKVNGGSFTPASCQGELLLKRLTATGCTYSD